MALEVEVDKWHDIGFTMPPSEIAECIPPPAITLPQKDADFWAGHKLPRGFSGPLEAPGIPGMIFERVGEVPRWRGERPLRDTLEPVYAAASRYALEHVFGRK
jgi:hypothetical protein